MSQFLLMGGYGIYVWSAYGIVLGFLTIEGFLTWRLWKQHNKNAYE